MVAKGHQIMVVSRNKEIEHQLLALYQIPFVSRGKGSTGTISKFIYLIYADLKILWLSIKFRPDVFLSFLHPYAAQVGWLLRKVSLVFSDTEHARLHHQLTVPFATRVFTPSCYRIDLGQKHVRFNSVMELCYLHPNHFTPNPDVLKLLGVSANEPFVIVRFVSWAAVHDIGHTGMTLSNKRKAVAELSKFARVFISAEGNLPEDLERNRINIPLYKMHDALYYCTLLFGESATMASEAAVLGTPSIFIDDDGRGYTDEEERRYHLVNNFTESEEDQDRAILRALEIMQDKGGKHKYEQARQQILSECIDTTSFLVEQVLQVRSA
jgi:predicted glycosyltransferase